MVTISESFREKMSTLMIKTLPEDGLSSAPMMFKSVDLPLPDGFTIATNSPFFIDRFFIPRSATTLPAADSNTLTTFSTFMTVESPLLLLPPSQHCPL